MSCFLCKSNYHISVNCDIHVSDEARKRVTRSKLHCWHCLAPFGLRHFFYDICKFNTKCYICFSKKHHTFFCPERSIIPCFYLPNIDVELGERFIQLFYPFEQYLIACATPKSLKRSLIKPLKIIKQISPSSLDEVDSSAVVVNGVIRYTNYCFDYQRNQKFLDLLNHKILIVKARILELNDTTLQRQEFFLFINFNLKDLKFLNLTVLPSITFAEILEKTPNIEEIVINKTSNIQIDKFWPDILLKYVITKKSFVKLKISIEDFDFDIKKLVEFMKKKCIKNADIMLNIHFSNQYPNFEENKKAFLKNIKKYFIPNGSSYRNESALFICIERNQSFDYSEKYILRK